MERRSRAALECAAMSVLVDLMRRWRRLERSGWRWVVLEEWGILLRREVREKGWLWRWWE
jgi:hypothetical protein